MLLQNKSDRVDYLLHHRVGTLPSLNYRIHTQTQHHHLRNPLLTWTDPQYHWVQSLLYSSCFLSGPKTQWKDMWKQTRWALTICYLGTLVLTLVLAFVLPDNLKVLVLITLILQMISYFMYTLSYVPFGRRLLKKTCQCLFSDTQWLTLNCSINRILSSSYLHITANKPNKWSYLLNYHHLVPLSSHPLPSRLSWLPQTLFELQLHLSLLSLTTGVTSSEQLLRLPPTRQHPTVPEPPEQTLSTPPLWGREGDRKVEEASHSGCPHSRSYHWAGRSRSFHNVCLWCP